MTHDPYLAPKSIAADPLEASHGVRWRGVLWFFVPSWLLMAGFVIAVTAAYLRSFTMALLELLLTCSVLVLPSAVIGHASERRRRTTSWLRYLVLSVRDAVFWAIAATLLVVLESHLGGGDPMGFGRAVDWILELTTILVPLTALLAASLRLRYRHGP